MLERLFVKRKIVESLGLSGSKEHVTTVCALNLSRNHRQLMGVELSLKKIMIDEEPYVMNALCVSHICEKAPANPSLEEYEHLKGLRLVDQSGDCDVALNKTIRVDELKPTAMKTKFGWVICGKNSFQNQAHILQCQVNEDCKS
ncbi:conserved hypothetical protein [Trichinella spiralis]|uniref:Peptidase aspartic putative domain-containing protein n=1 Tax=Trichinella spiralis TaxID=6334 RepID=E5SVS7_TRISP|nr:conserved hypothetical protein [Trichinella spiralis]KRY29755.1 hypothetical protein T01_10690 [Trichinella spiralis]